MLSPLTFMFIGQSVLRISTSIEPYSYPDRITFCYCNKFGIEELDTAWL
jgi:hypothetical protein